MPHTIEDLIAGHPDEAKAIGAPDRDWMSYGGLRALSADVAEALHAQGIGRGDRVAIVLPNGPEMAAAFVTVAQACVTAPLNPAYREEEFAFYLDDLKARAVILMEGEDGPAAAAAETLGMRIIGLAPDTAGPAGSFALTGRPADTAGDRSSPEGTDVALILHTSGTTSRPKILPLLQSNVAASAENIAASLDLTPDDRCLNVMPLFHIHGLIAAVLATLGSGGQVWCAPGFDALRFFGWLRDAGPTWYTAVPTMHQAIPRPGRAAIARSSAERCGLEVSPVVNGVHSRPGGSTQAFAETSRAPPPSSRALRDGPRLATRMCLRTRLPPARCRNLGRRWALPAAPKVASSPRDPSEASRLARDRRWS